MQCSEGRLIDELRTHLAAQHTTLLSLAAEIAAQEYASTDVTVLEDILAQLDMQHAKLSAFFDEQWGSDRR